MFKHCISKQSCIKKGRSLLDFTVENAYLTVNYGTNFNTIYLTDQMLFSVVFIPAGHLHHRSSWTAALRCQVSSTAGWGWAHSHISTEYPDQ